MAESPKFDFLSEDFSRNPYGFYAALRERSDLYYYSEFDVWMASRFADVSEILFHPKMVRSLGCIASPAELAELQRKGNWHEMPHHERFVQFSMLDSDGDVHDRLRQMVFKVFSPRMIARQRDYVQSFVDRLIDQVTDRPVFDFVEEFAALVPGHVIGNLLGVPAEDCGQLRTWSEGIVRYFDIDRSDALKIIAETATREFYDYLTALSAERMKRPADDLISHLNAKRAAGEMTEDEFISTCMLILMAGHGSTTDVLGSGLHALIRFPHEAERIRADPGMTATAVQEMFRFESPLPFFHRYCTEDVVIGGRTFAKGTKFGMLLGSANRDPAQFVQPDRFDAGRSPNRHLAFGGGAHFCLGNQLSRLNMEVIFSSLLKRFSRIELAENDPAYRRGLSVRGPKRLLISCRS